MNSTPQIYNVIAQERGETLRLESAINSKNFNVHHFMLRQKKYLQRIRKEDNMQ